MTLMVRIVALLGWRAAVGMGLGALLATVPAYQLGKWTEGAAAQERVARILVERDVKRMEAENARIEKALAARRDAISHGGGAAGGRLPDDGYRRD
ncbi:hypothetical protein [Acuticoccus kandeliae]|uniref:hypothetical protein n=1 Tax=Acuticoccus kandeliae TaxID=2073160 RepID=UPI000D3E1C7E|nr:hypothetical protein [Acuticoccus kandeliae]